MSRSIRIAASTSGAIFFVSAFVLYVARSVDVALSWLLMFVSVGVGLLVGVLSTAGQAELGQPST
ncbi:hypothetical protein ADK67_24740 [Saccharothrix sp. NRRL B-16348]|uniref:hypothetical protein n=1 Tax=Saccharothrix sp. NRRL B-16348 TaxID=1415542 RepID=UPI0006AE7610|nr:hypothetical protein [Saccharothrix sp. NRRL B-16348]KOX21888.1 hypothetical protein ADK67_24740 [Saccharothrix sp. NRRL B-16348]